MLTYAFVFVSAVVLIGLYMLMQTAQKKRYTKWFPLAHLGLDSVGALLVIVAALAIGGMLLWANIGLAVIVAALGIAVGLRKFHGAAGKMLLALHVVLAVICYLFLMYNVFA
ncbi:MAG: hypothetical protein FWC38_08720 [Proteobacteria bacterium]|nr:hypothetical protein [Pseudomonadota bacterium]MCL2308283.1 hypothetical protein [Pseudomonadota bacterium]